MNIAIALLLAVSSPAFMEKPLDPAYKDRLEAGEIIRECQREKGTQSVGYAIGLFNAPIDVMWQALADLEQYDEFVERTTVSVLIDEATALKAKQLGPVAAEPVEALFPKSVPGFRKPDPAVPGGYVVYSYQRNDLPWPASDRWIILEMAHDPAHYRQSWTRVAGNIQEDHGVWQLIPYGPKRTLGVLEIHMDLALPATGMFVDYAMNLSLPETYAGFEAIAKSLMPAARKGF